MDMTEVMAEQHHSAHCYQPMEEQALHRRRQVQAALAVVAGHEVTKAEQVLNSAAVEVPPPQVAMVALTAEAAAVVAVAVATA